MMMEEVKSFLEKMQLIEPDMKLDVTGYANLKATRLKKEEAGHRDSGPASTARQKKLLYLLLREVQLRYIFKLIAAGAEN
jgi:hypothetical protein